MTGQVCKSVFHGMRSWLHTNIHSLRKHFLNYFRCYKPAFVTKLQVGHHLLNHALCELCYDRKRYVLSNRMWNKTWYQLWESQKRLQIFNECICFQLSTVRQICIWYLIKIISKWIKYLGVSDMVENKKMCYNWICN